MSSPINMQNTKSIVTNYKIRQPTMSHLSEYIIAPKDYFGCRGTIN